MFVPVVQTLVSGSAYGHWFQLAQQAMRFDATGIAMQASEGHLPSAISWPCGAGNSAGSTATRSCRWHPGWRPMKLTAVQFPMSML